jgi:hypothetical protein
MVVTTQIVGTPTVENRTALAHRRKTAFAVFLFLPAYNSCRGLNALDQSPTFGHA